MRHRNVSIRPADFVSSDAIQRAKDLPVAEFPGATTIGELAGLSFTDFFVRWCEAAVRSREKPWSTMQHMGRQIIGTVSEGDTLAHVVYRVRGESIWLAGRLEVMPLKSVQGRWLMLMNDDVIWRFPLVGPH